MLFVWPDSLQPVRSRNIGDQIAGAPVIILPVHEKPPHIGPLGTARAIMAIIGARFGYRDSGRRAARLRACSFDSFGKLMDAARHIEGEDRADNVTGSLSVDR